MKYFIRFYQVLGLLPIDPFNAHGKNNLALLIWSSIVITGNLSVTLLAFYWADEIFYSNDEVGKFNDWIKYVAACVGFYVALFESVLQRKWLLLYMKKIRIVTNFLRAQHLPVEENLQLHRRRFSRLFLPMVLFSFSFFIFEQYLTTEKSMRMKLYTYICVIPALTCRFRHFQFAAAIIDFLGIQQSLNGGIRDIIRLSRARKVDEATDRLLRLKSMQSEIFSMSECANAFFGWSAAMNFAYNFAQITCDMYWFYMNTIAALQVNDRGIMFLLLLMYQLTTILTCIALAHAASSFYKERDRTPELIHKIVRQRDEDVELDDAIRHFSLQLKHEKIVFTAHGFFEIGYSLIGNIGVGVATYMVIFVQFAPMHEPVDLRSP